MARPYLIVAAVALALASCAGDSTFPIIQSRLAAMKGKPVTSLLQKLGEPDSKDTVDGGHVYVWDGSSAQHVNFWTNFSQCALKVYVDKSDTITGFFHSGTDSACAQYADRLDNRL
jgi:hypothetical protein